MYLVVCAATSFSNEDNPTLASGVAVGGSEAVLCNNQVTPLVVRNMYVSLFASLPAPLVLMSIEVRWSGIFGV